MYERFQSFILPFCFFMIFIIAGCNFNQKEKNVNIDPPQDVQYVDEGEENSLEGSENEHDEADGESANIKTVKRQLYLIDENGLVVPQTIEIPVPESKEVATQALEYLVKDGPVTELLPNGFQAVLPAGTEILGVNIKDGVAIADFSEEFKEYKAEDEQKILQAITWTLTQFDNIDKVKIRINGHDQDTMPVDGTPISDGLSREDGINIDVSHVTDVTNSIGVTLYFLAQSGDKSYYVPISKRIPNSGDMDKIEATVIGLIEGPSIQSGLFSDVPKETELLKAQKDSNGIVTLNFNEAILDNQKIISNASLHSLVLSLTELEDVNEVAIQVNGETNVLTESGDPLTQPVTREMVTKAIAF